MAWSADIRELDGTFVRTLINCNIGEVPLNPLNPRGETYATITIPKHELGPAIGQYADLWLGREVVIFDGVTPRFRGVPMKRAGKSGDGAITIDVHDLGWYLTKANITRPIRNLLVNGNFEAGTTGWTAVGCTMEATSSRVRRGSGAVKLTGSATFAEQYIYQQVAVTGTAVGTELTTAAHFNIDTWSGPAIYSRGLFIQSIASGVVETFNDRDGVIDDDTALALDEWQRREATTWVPPSATRTEEVRFYVGNGVTYVDEIELVEPSSLAIAPGSGEDIATTANRIIQFAQTAAYGKSDKNIGTTTPPTTGVKFFFPKSYQYADKTPVDTALEEIVSLGVDYTIEATATAKTFTVHYPLLGSDLTGSITLTFPAGNVASYEWDEDNDPVETDSTVLGEGDGPDREEGHAVEASEAHGLVLEGVESAPVGTTIDKLDPLATARLSVKKRPVRVLTITTKGAVAVDTGDLVTVDIADGVIDIAGTWRVVDGHRLPKTNGGMSLVLNETADSIVLTGGVSGTSSALAYSGGSATTESYSIIGGGRAA